MDEGRSLGLSSADANKPSLVGEGTSINPSQTTEAKRYIFKSDADRNRNYNTITDEHE
jgi:hypothetical protein